MVWIHQIPPYNCSLILILSILEGKQNIDDLYFFFETSDCGYFRFRSADTGRVSFCLHNFSKGLEISESLFHTSAARLNQLIDQGIDTKSFQGKIFLVIDFSARKQLPRITEKSVTLLRIDFQPCHDKPDAAIAVYIA